MKRPIILAFALVVSSLFLSCSNDEDIAQPQQSTELFKTFQLKRDATGAYSLDLNLDDNVKVENFKNTTTNTNELYLIITDDNVGQKSNLQSDLMFNDENFKVDFITENSDKVPSISVFDDNIKFAKKADDKFLKNYSVTKIDDSTYDLDFDVASNISVDFVYNEEINVYEVHLEEGNKSQENNTYTRTLEKEENNLLQIHFVNHTINNAKTSELLNIRKPIIVVDDGSKD
ncbi:hypothetical protein [uncultured Polaribacter sp.]|mgnify:FL=1|uniref:hypothetical protein n=1 Tax=uncultured Polaribacter sp. TaxID=174711 RepID=UPI0030D89DB0|tara:strand:+ start:11636 stop:12328 length:693 start_codon:yes stop_codon:yes gene_type:complete